MALRSTLHGRSLAKSTNVSSTLGPGVARRRFSCRASVAPEVAAAVSQQAIAYSIVVVGEGFLTRSNLPESDKGRPNVQVIAAGAGGTALAAVLASSGIGGVTSVGVIGGILVAGGMCYANARRFLDVETDDGDWPGNKAWPASMVLVSFFILAAWAQALKQDIISTF